MRMILDEGTPQQVIIEGTVEEIIQFRATMKLPPASNSAFNGLSESPKAEAIDGLDDDWWFVSEDVAYRALTRIKLSREQKIVLRELYKADTKWTTAEQLQVATGYTPSRFAGLMGAFGRRVTHTRGWVADSCFFEQEWNPTKGCNVYRIPASVRTAMLRAKLV